MIFKLFFKFVYSVLSKTEMTKIFCSNLFIYILRDKNLDLCHHYEFSIHLTIYMINTKMVHVSMSMLPRKSHHIMYFRVLIFHSIPSLTTLF